MAAAGASLSTAASPPSLLPSAVSPSLSSPSSPSPSPSAGLTIVLKVGSGSLSTSDGRFVHLSVLSGLVELVCSLMRDGHRVLLVTSGAVSIGCQRLALPSRPTSLIVKQAVAAVGQSRLMRLYDDLFSQLQQPIAQVLLSRENLNKRHHYTNAHNTFSALLDMRVVPIVNENDTVAVEELRFGDNDTLSALVASLVSADCLFLLTDVDCLYSHDPRRHPQLAQPIHVVDNVDKLQADVGSGEGGGSNEWGTGGMATKLQAARIASSAGCRTCIVHCQQLNRVKPMLAGDTATGTTFLPLPRPLRSTKRFIAHGLSAQGSLILDSGASRAVCDHKSLFAAGIVAVHGTFPAQSSVRLIDAERQQEIGRGVVSYASSEIAQLKGRHSNEYASILGYQGDDEIVHRDSLVVTTSHPQASSAVSQQPPPQQTQQQRPQLPSIPLQTAARVKDSGAYRNTAATAVS